MSAGPTLDALLPEDVARKAEALGVAKAKRDVLAMMTLSVLAGAFIALGAMFSTIVATGLPDVLPLGLSRVLPAIACSLGLILVVWRRTVHRRCADGDRLGQPSIVARFNAPSLGNHFGRQPRRRSRNGSDGVLVGPMDPWPW